MTVLYWPTGSLPSSSDRNLRSSLGKRDADECDPAVGVHNHVPGIRGGAVLRNRASKPPIRLPHNLISRA